MLYKIDPAQEKTGHGPVFSSWLSQPSSEGADLCVQSALVSSRFVFMNQALGCQAVEQRGSCLVGFGRGILVARFDRLEHFLDLGAHHAASTGVVLAVLFGLTGPLERLS